MSASPLSVENLSFRYRRREDWAIENISFEVQPGQVLLIAGASGCGKTTLMRSINGLIPNTYSGEMTGDIRLFGTSVKEMPMPAISQTVGTLLQDPERQILGSYVLNEVAFGLESLGLPHEVITPRVEKALDRLGILPLRDRETFRALRRGEAEDRSGGCAGDGAQNPAARRGLWRVSIQCLPMRR